MRDLTGQRFHMLTAIRPLQGAKGKGIIWLCRCDCGSEAHVPASLLTSGHTRSCGCLKKAHAAAIRRTDITGKQFGHLTALRPTDRRGPSGAVIWELQCDCGNLAYYDVNTLNKGAARSCGCTGVSWNARNQKWTAYIDRQKKRHYLGSFDDKEQAIRARQEAEKALPL